VFAPHRFPQPLTFATVCLLVLAGGAPVRAAETRWWSTATSGDYEGAETRGVVIDPDGVLALGPETSSSTVDSIDVAWSLAVLEDGSVAMGGDRGRIVRWTRGGGAAAWVTLPVGQVLSLLADGDDLIAGTGPDGWIYRVRANGDTTRIASTGERYVWALVPDGDRGWFAATGTRGRILHVARNGTVRTRLDTEETNIVSLASDARGGVFAGGDTQGRVLHVRADGTSSTLFDAPEEEIRAVARGADGAVYAAALSARAVQSAGADDDSEAVPRPVRRPAIRGETRIYRIVPDSSVTAWWTAPSASIFALIDSPGGLLAAAGHRAGLFRIEGRGRASRWLATADGPVTALVAAGDGEWIAATSNPVRLWRLEPGRRRAGELVSPALDAKRFARFGALRWSGDAGGGRVAFATRSGNTPEPDTTWTAWREARGEVAAPPARYLQWKLELEGGRPSVESVEIAWRETNAPPSVGGLRVAVPVEGFRDGRLSTRTEPVTQELPGGRKVEFSLKRRSDEGERADLPLWVQGLRTVQWSADDPNEDPLRYRIDVRREGDGDWIPVAVDLPDSVHVWDTNIVPDGRYRLRVTASDTEGNPLGEALETAVTSPVVTVDNSPPVIAAFTVVAGAGRAMASGRASDSAGPLARIEIAIDGGPWRAVAPEGGLADRPDAAFAVALEEIAPGPHAITLRVVDRAGNFALRAARVTVPNGR
jgi:hypothetical protein